MEVQVTLQEMDQTQFFIQQHQLVVVEVEQVGQALVMLLQVNKDKMVVQVVVVVQDM